MLALQSMGVKSSHREPEAPLSIITNGSTPKHSLTPNDVAAQLVTLTEIARSLQKEMSALTRRSRDNATDLLSLKEATKTRDDDVRKSLREIVGNITDSSSRIASFSGPLLDNKPFGSSPTTTRQFQLPRIPSLKSFAESIDRGSISTPSLSAVDTSASLLLLEKIWNGLGTQEGHKSLVGLLTELSQTLSGMATSAKVEELADYVRSQSENAVVLGNSNRGRSVSDESMDLHKPVSGPMTHRVERLLHGHDSRRLSAPSSRGADLVNEDLMKIIRSVKDSVAQGGGLTAEVKALVRELRGEVLGMGRELGKRLEKVGVKGIEETEAPSKDEVSRVIDEGLEQMKEQLNHVLREHRRQSAQSHSSQKTVVDYREIYNAMRAALRDNEGNRADMSDLSREDVIKAVREAWENYKPEFEVQQIGLERDEVLACLREGLQEYAPLGGRPDAATREEVFKAVVEGLKHFSPPRVDTPASLSRDEIFEAVRDCLEEFEFPVSASAIGNEMSHKDVVHAVREGLSELDLPRGNALVAVPNTDEIVSRLRDIMEYMKLEFRAVSEEAKENVAANGRDTEQVLDATKDGLENLRIAIEGYVDRVSGAAGHEEFMVNLSRTMEEFKQEVSRAVAQTNDSSREQLQTELAGLREVVNSSMVPATPQASPGANNQEVLDALQTGLTGLRQEILRPRPETSEIIDAIQDGLNDLRVALDRVTNKPVDLTANDEILDALKAGLDSVRSDIEAIRDASNDRAVAAVGAVNEDNDGAVVPADMVKQDDIRNLEVLITQLRIKVEAMEPESDGVHRDDISRLEEILRNVQEGVEEVRTREPTVAAAATAPSMQESRNVNATGHGDAASKDDVQAIETILRNTKASLDDLIEGEQAVRREHIDAVETLVLETRETMTSLVEQLAAVSQKEDLAALETLVTQVSLTLDEVKEKSDKASAADEEVATKSGVEAVEALVLEMKAALDGLASTDFAAISNKEDVTSLEAILKEAKANIDTYNEATGKALDDRQAEIVGVADRVSEVKSLMEEFQEAVKSKLEESSGGVDALAKLLEGVGEKMDKNENVGADLKEMYEAMKTQFEENKEVVAGSRLESNEKLQEAADTLGAKLDEKVAELTAKYDELKSAWDERDDTNEARCLETEAAVSSTKAIAEDLKLLIDTLGSTVTDSLEKMEEASRTVFSKVEDLATRTEEGQAEGKTEHEQTREQIQRAASAVEGLQGEVKEMQPQILEVVKDILLLVGEHFEHSKTSTSDIGDKIAEVKPFDQAMLPAPDKYDDSHVREKLALLAEQRYDDSEVKEKLDRLAEQRYDDGAVQEKLDRLADQAATTVQAVSHLETLDKVHQSVVTTASELSQFLSAQTQRIADEHEDREKKLQDTIVELERKLAEREHVEAAVLSLRDEQARLHANVVHLRNEQGSLIRQKTRLSGDVGSLETALRLRKEELGDMERRAERLERRIMEGVMDHSRVLLMSKSSRDGDKSSMSRKRVKKPAGEKAGRPVVSMALAAHRGLAVAAQSQNGSARRIASLSQMESSSPSALARRSQSVRSPAGGGGGGGLRKRSWGGGLVKAFGDDDDKENRRVRDTVEELDEPDSVVSSSALGRVAYTAETDSLLGSAADGDDDDDNSEATDTDTLRRTSAGTTILSSSQYTDSDVGYSDLGETGSEWTESAVDGGGGGNDEGGAVVVYGT